MKSIREIFNSLTERDETVIFQVKTRKVLNDILRDLEEVDEWIWWDTYKKIPVKDVYLFVGNWRLGNVGIFPYKSIDCYGEYRFDDFLVDWKSTDIMIRDQRIKFDKVINIFDKYRKGIKISKKKYEDVS